MAEDTDKDKTEPATPFKLREAKKRGQVAKSLEFNSLFVIAGFLAALYVVGERMIYKQLVIDRAVFEQAYIVNYDIPRLVAWFEAVFGEVLFAISPLAIFLLVVVIIANVIQTGPVLTFFPLKPDFKRLNPATGFKRIFSTRILFEAFKNVVKLTVFGAILYFGIRSILPELFAMMNADPYGYPHQLIGYLGSLIFMLVVALLIIAILDFAYTRWDYAKKMKMSKRELREEVKRREGDPHVRARLRELQKELRKKSKAIRRVPDADVLITNPTHLAVAVLYRREEMTAPKVIAKGVGKLAQAMKEIARKHRIPIIEDKGVAQLLFAKTGLDGPIPEGQYGAVARILASVYAMRNLTGVATE